MVSIFGLWGCRWFRGPAGLSGANKTEENFDATFINLSLFAPKPLSHNRQP